MNKTLIVLGATGLVGSYVLKLALTDERVERVIAPTRKPLPSHPKLQMIPIDVDRLAVEADRWRVDAALCALGTTRARAGSAEAFRRIDLDLPLGIARTLKQHKVETFAIVSAMAAHPRSRLLYFRTKGELEEELAQLGFLSLTIVRPGLIGGRSNASATERLAVRVLDALGPILPPRRRLNPASAIARQLFDAALELRPGHHVIEADRLTGHPAR